MISRRALLASTAVIGLAGPAFAAGFGRRKRLVQPVPLADVRLTPSIFADAVETNRRYLLALEPDRLLHNFRKSAGLPPKGRSYGGWEARGIAGHTLGHYLSACALMVAQTGDEAVRERLHYTIAELARCQAAHGDGYIGGTTVERDGIILDGKIVFEEIRRGEIRTGGFDVNGGWVPLYTWHKMHAGLVEACRLGGIAEALPVMVGMVDYLAAILEPLSDQQIQLLLAAEHGGLNESYADSYELTGNKRYLDLAERIYHRAVLSPLAEGRDVLAGLHANTQIPKVIGLARLHELTGDVRHAAAARFFHSAVLSDHSFVIGGNSEREHFGPPDLVSPLITDRTCEACNTYNMLKLTRHLYAWDGDASRFDYYERAHLNHIMAHQHPRTGMFVYFMPLGAGARRTYSTPEDSFWCCVGSGLESHSKHGDSIFWYDDAALYVNLFIPSKLSWRAKRMNLTLNTDYPFSEDIELVIDAPGAAPPAIALRVPGWCSNPKVEFNGEAARYRRRDGYAILTRSWRKGDVIRLTLPMRLAVEPAPDDPSLLAFVHGPIVLAADLGPAHARWNAPSPALVGDGGAGALEPVDSARHLFRMAAAKPEPLLLSPFFNQYDRRTAVYFPIFTSERWATTVAAYAAEESERRAVEARTVDAIILGEMPSERDHGFTANHSEFISYGGRSGRQAWWGQRNYLEFTLAVGAGPMTLRALYWGEETNKDFDIFVDGVRVANERRSAVPTKRFEATDYPIPVHLTRGKKRITIRFETRGTDAPVYEVRTLSESVGA
jgi:uncharacterized protein